MNPSPAAWARVGGICGIAAMVSYVLMIAVPLADSVVIWPGALFGPLLLLGSMGLYHVLTAERHNIAAQAALGFNALACALITAMLMVQMALHTTAAKLDPRLDTNVMREFNSIHFGLDVAWDIYGALGVIAFGIAMLRNANFGRMRGGAGILVGVALLALNLYTFPIPPAGVNLPDLGPLVGLWYTLISFRTLRIARRLELRQTAASAA
jgi:hypothetical protein